MSRNDPTERDVIPLRAIEFITHPPIAPAEIAYAVRHIRKFPVLRIAGDHLCRVLNDAEIRNIRNTAFGRADLGMHSAWAPAFPAGTFVMRSSLELLAKKLGERKGRVPIRVSTWPRLVPSVELYVLEGFQSLWAREWSVPLGEGLLYQLAAKLRIDIDEAITVVLGRVPRMSGIVATPAYLATVDPAVMDLIDDVERGRIQVPCMPAVLATWAAKNGIVLQKAFRLALMRVVSAGVELLEREAAEARAAESAVRANPLGDLSQDDDRHLQQLANEIALDLRKKDRNGRWPTKRKVAAILAANDGRGDENILRRIRKEWASGRPAAASTG